MKVTVTFNTIKIVVPCGDGEITVRELTQLATTRYKKATGKPKQSWVSVHSLKAKEGGILDPDDFIQHVCDDREQLIAFYDEEGIPQGGDGMSASSDESETTGGSSGGYNRNTDIEVSGDYGTVALQVRRGSEPALNKIEATGAARHGVSAHQYGNDGDHKRWSAAVLNRDVKSSKTDLSVIDEASFYSDRVYDQSRLSPLPPPFERGQGSGAARGSDRPNPFSRDSNRLSMQIGHEDARWLEAAEKATEGNHARQGSHDFDDSGLSYRSDWDRNSNRVRREPLGGSSPPLPPQTQQPVLDRSSYTMFVIQNEIGPLGIHVAPSGDQPEAAGLLIQGIEPGGRIDRDNRLVIGDRIVEINGYSLIDIPFHKAQEIFKEALYSKELQLLVSKADDPNANRSFEENKENINIESDTGTLNKKLGVGPGSKLSSAVQAANTRKIGKKLTVVLVKGVHGLGFSITTRDIQSGGPAPIYIKNILSKGAAIENGQLKPGDRLLEINQESVDGKSQSEVVAILRNTPQQGEVILIVSRQEIVEEIEANTLELRGKEKQRPLTPSTSSSNNKPQQPGVSHESSSGSTAPNTEESEEYTSVSPDVSVNSCGDVVFPWKHREILTLDIPVHDTERAGLGVSVKGKTTGGGAKGIVDLGIFVKSVIHGGAASKDGRLKTNDQLVNINGASLLGKANCDAMDTLRRAMHEEGPTPGVITLTVARRLDVGANDSSSKLRSTGRDSVTSMLTSSSGDDSYREYKVSLNNSSHNNTGESSLDNTRDDTVIYVDKVKQPKPFDNFLPPAPRNPVVERLMGKKGNDAQLRNESYYRATGHDTFNATMLQRLDSPDAPRPFKSPTVHQAPRDTVMIEQSPESQANVSKMSDSDVTDVAYASQTSLEEPISAFARDQPGRQSMSEKRHATLDAKSTDTYQRSRKARLEREQATKEVGPTLGMKKSSSLESLQTMMTEFKMDNVRGSATRSKNSKVVRGRGCNESFRAAVDRSYEASHDSEDQQDPEIMETFDRANYRQSGSSLDSNNEFKKKKNAKIFKFGMFKFGQKRAKSSDSGRLSAMNDRKTPTNDIRQTPTNELNDDIPRVAGWADEEAKAKLVAEQARIQQHYKRLVQQRKEYDQEKGDLVDEVYQGKDSKHDHKELLPASLAAARPGSRSGITGGPTNQGFSNYNDEIQRHLSRRQAQYHSQRREHPARSDRPVSNFYEYESVQSAISHGRQISQTSIGSGGSGGGFMHPPGLPIYSDSRTISPSRQEMPPPRHLPPPPHYSQHQAKQGGNMMPAPPSKYGYYATTGRAGMADYEEHRNFHGPTINDYDDPYGRIMFRDGAQVPAGRRPSHPGSGPAVASVSGHTVPGHRPMQHSLSHPRIQSHQQVPNNQMYKVPSTTLPAGSKV